MTNGEIRKAKIDLVCKILTDYRKAHQEDYKMAVAICAAVEALDYADELDADLHALNHIMLEWEKGFMKVYILVYYNYDEREIYGVYTSKELAESKIPEVIEELHLDPEEYDFDVQVMGVEDDSKRANR